MEERSVLNLDEKIQKLINGYTEIKSRYADAVVAKTELEKQNAILSEFKNENEEKLLRLIESDSKQREEVEFLKNENRNLRDQLDEYNDKMKEASTKIDSIFNQLNDL
jgi:predicted nuclease with TOPRIM domain